MSRKAQTPETGELGRSLRELQFRTDRDCAGDADGHWTAAGVKLVRPQRRLSLIVRAALQAVADADPLDHQHLLFQDHVPLSLRAERAVRCVDPTRLQRAPEGACQSTGGRGHNVVEGRRMVRIEAARGPVMLANLVVGPERDRLRLRREEGPPDRSPIPDDADSRHVIGLLFHLRSLRFPDREGGMPLPAAHWVRVRGGRSEDCPGRPW